MKSFDIFNALENIDEKYIDEARRPKGSLAKKLKVWAIPAVAALLTVTLTLGAVLSRSEERPSGKYDFPDFTPKDELTDSAFRAFALASPTLPERFDFTEANQKEWFDQKSELMNAYKEAGVDFSEFMSRALPVILESTGGESTVCSPVNIYIAFSMLAEVTDGNSRREILDVLGVDSIESLRQQVGAIWEAAYRDDGITKSLLANSLWLSDTRVYNTETVLRLSELYFASTFSGKMGSEEYNEALRQWLDYNTGGLLSDQISGIELPEDTVMSLASTIYFSGGWALSFKDSNNTEKVFNGVNSNVLCEFMNQEFNGNYYEGKGFSSVSKRVGEGEMHFILPDKSESAEKLLKSDAFVDFIMKGECQKTTYSAIELSVPKFDISSDIDLTEKMEKLGIDDILDSSTADFSPLYDKELYVGKATHGARVRIDEEGCVGAAYTVILAYGTSSTAPPLPEVEFILDRPFIFVVTNEAGIPLFVGVINQL